MLPRISGKECVKALEKKSFYIKRRKGSHIIMRRDAPFTQVVIPDHPKLDRGTLRAILKQTGISIEEFVKLLE